MFILFNLDINEDESPLLVKNGNDCLPTRTYNGQHRKHARLSLYNVQTRTTVDQSTSTTDLNKTLRDQSTSTEDISVDIRSTEKDVRGCINDNERMNDKTNSKGVLSKTKSSPNIMKGTKNFLKFLILLLPTF